ncbi:MAG: hypothetical protein OXR67_08315 [Chloroflexota bacterium]|nr:hypothetical protein [Chloroflexota bacterium]
MDRKTRPATGAPSADAEDDEAARLAAFLFGEEAKETDPPREAPFNLATEYEAARLAARLFGEKSAGSYLVAGRLIRFDRLPVGDLGLLTVGFRITDRPNEKWTRRFNRFKYGEPAAVRAATRTLCAAFDLFRLDANPRVVVVSSVSSGQNIVRNDTPASILASALAESRGWEWLPHHVTKDRHPSITGIPSAAERDATVDGVYLAAPIGGGPGLVVVVDDFCTRGATFADIARAIRESNPGWEIQPVSLAKTERAAYWNGELTNAHIPHELDAIWRGAPEAASPFY